MLLIGVHVYINVQECMYMYLMVPPSYILYIHVHVHMYCRVVRSYMCVLFLNSWSHLRENIKHGVYVDGLTEQSVSSARDAYEVS